MRLYTMCVMLFTTAAAVALAARPQCCYMTTGPALARALWFCVPALVRTRLRSMSDTEPQKTVKAHDANESGLGFEQSVDCCSMICTQ
eukprot:13584-Heterococcus_DN1.PRE.1